MPEIADIVPSTQQSSDRLLVRRGVTNPFTVELLSAMPEPPSLTSMPTNRIKGRVTAGSGAAEDLTPTQLTAMLDVYTSVLKGLVPASGGGTANFLRADGTWAAPAPAGATTKVQFNNAGAFGAASDVEIEGGQLRLPAIATPAAPAAGGLKLFAKSVGGRLLPEFLGPTGLDTLLQPHQGLGKVAMVQPNGNSTTLSTMGIALTATGTPTAKNWASATRYGRMRGLEYLVTTAAANVIAGWRGAAGQFTVGGPSAGDGGFHYVCRWGPATGVAVTTNRCFVGFIVGGAVETDVEPSSRLNICGMGWDSADGNIQFMYNDGSGTATKIDLGASFPVPTTDRNNVYEIAMFSPPGTTQSVSYRVTDLLTGAEASGTVTTDLPANTVALNTKAFFSSGTATVNVVGLTLFGLYVETDY